STSAGWRAVVGFQIVRKASATCRTRGRPPRSRFHRGELWEVIRIGAHLADVDQSQIDLDTQLVRLTRQRLHQLRIAHALELVRTPVGRRRSADAERAPHSITSSARAMRVGGNSRPSALAVFKLMTSSYLVGVCTGRSAGFSPLRMRSTYVAARRKLSVRSTPWDSKPPTSAKKRNG